MTEQAMKHFLASCEGIGIALPASACEQLAAFDALLAEANQRMDLTAVLDPLEAVDRHYIDSLTPLAHAALLPEGARIIDIGSGAGFPGIPLMIARPDLTCTLLDAQGKRVKFLEMVIERLALPAEAVHARAEDFARLPERRETYDVAVSRAVTGLPALLELSLPMLRVGGHALLWKGPAVRDEWADGEAAAALLGGALTEPIAAPVPGRDWQHLLVRADKRQKTVRQYPRKAGEPSRKPLRATE